MENSVIKRWQAREDLINFPRTPLGLSGLILNIIRDYFQFNSGQFQYSPNPIESKVVIDLHQQWKPENCENYPGIFIQRGDWSLNVEGKVIGNYNQFLMEEDGFSYSFWVPITTFYSIICVGKEYGELEKLLNEVYLFLTIFSDPIRKIFGFHKFNVLKLSGVSLAKEEKNYRIGQIDLHIVFDFIWKLTLEKGLIKEVRNDI